MATDKGKDSTGDKPKGEPNDFGDNIRLAEAGQSMFIKAAAVAVIALGIAAVLGMMKGDGFKRFSYSYLTAFMWVLAIMAGGVFWVTLQNLVGAKWSVVVRRVGELFATNAPVIGLLSLPIVVPVLLGNPVLYKWADHALVHNDHLLHHKAGYLNPTFFAIRVVIYFGFWTWLSYFFYKRSLAQDVKADPNVVGTMKRAAGPSMIVFALCVTFAAIDFAMSLDPYWFSTMFGVYYFASCQLGVHSAMALTLMWFQGQGRLTKSVTLEHYHDIGKMMFAFTVFWAYSGFSQFMLIWYANIPEETAWFKERFAGDWGTVSWILLFGHFVIPFFGLLSRHVKRNKKALGFWAVWILAVIYIDMYWLIIPNLKTEHIPFDLMDVLCLLGLGSAFFAGVAYRAKSINLLPVKDPRLAQSLAFENI
jgi:hypothetical protein